MQQIHGGVMQPVPTDDGCGQCAKAARHRDFQRAIAAHEAEEICGIWGFFELACALHYGLKSVQTRCCGAVLLTKQTEAAETYYYEDKPMVSDGRSRSRFVFRDNPGGRAGQRAGTR